MNRTELQITRARRTEERLRTVSQMADAIGISENQIMVRWYNVHEVNYWSRSSDARSGVGHLRRIHNSLNRNGIHCMMQDDRGNTGFTLYIDTRNLSEETINYLTVTLAHDDYVPDVYGN